LKQNIHVWHLEITDSCKVPVQAQPAGYRLLRLETALPEFARFMYMAVGAPWNWYMRLRWNYRDWQSRLSSDKVELWIAYQGATPAGYFELEVQANRSVEICYFGLIPDFIGRGMGGPLLEDAVRRAWTLSGKRVWLHTCTLDHPQALNNYLARGFEIFKEEDLIDHIPDQPIQPWEGANKPC
jgi:GNAT superfamily N-acetyltransferase